jgi:uncharacterized protein (DUF983 family)
MAPISKLRAVIGAKCPRCRQGDIFSGGMYRFSITGQAMNEYCPVCQLRFEREPGYFYVSMFISYGMTVAEMIAVGVLLYIGGLPLIYENLWWYVGVLLAAILLLAPLNYRYSRVMLLHWLTPGLGYVPGAGDSNKSGNVSDKN